MVTRTPETEDERRRARGRPDGTHAGFQRGKRVATAMVGALLLVRGLRRRSLRGVAAALVGGWFLVRALGGGRRLGEVLDPSWSTEREPAGRSGGPDAPAVSRSITIGKPAEELYDAWRDPDQLSQVVGHVADVTSSAGDRLRWSVHGPFGRDVSWETRFVEEEPGEFLRWATPRDAVLPHDGAIRFRPAPGDRGTEVTLSLDFDPPGGTLGDVTLERLDVVPATLADEALRRFKSLVESGEVPTLERNPSARGRGDWI